MPADQHIRWQISDPSGKGLDIFRKIRDEIRLQVEHLIQQIKQTK